MSEIDIGSIMIMGLVFAEENPTNVVDYDDDGTPDLMVKFDRASVRAILGVGDKKVTPIPISNGVFRQAH